MAVYTSINDPELFFQNVLYTGTGVARDVTFPGTANMQPDMVWLAERNTTSGHGLYDSARGVDKVLFPYNTDVEGTSAQRLTAFNSDGFRVGTSGATNGSSDTYVAWCWKAGTTSGITTTGADITPSAYSFNHTSGISIAAYTGNGSSGAKIAHGLGAIPEMMIIKPRDRAGQAWVVYHHKNTSAPQTDYLALDANDATADGAWPWNDAVPTSVYLETQSNNGTNASGNTFILYTFRGVNGYSKFGSYIGNGNADGPMVHTGFSPAYVVVKNAGGSEAWNVWNNKTPGFNVANKNLQPSGSVAEQTSSSGVKEIDFTANGFKVRGSNTELNQSGNTMVYMAFAENPFVNSSAIPTNAR